ncbi:MAG: hypothetical protein ACRDQZ_20505 [Mycobacteriales bacterium]
MSTGFDGISGRAHQVIVMVGEPEPTRVVGLRRLGFSAVTVDEQVVIWSRALPVLTRSHPSPATAPSPAEPPGGTGLLMTIADAAAALGSGGARCTNSSDAGNSRLCTSVAAPGFPPTRFGNLWTGSAMAKAEIWRVEAPTGRFPAKATDPVVYAGQASPRADRMPPGCLPHRASHRWHVACTSQFRL